jgi:hypothetical protein
MLLVQQGMVGKMYFLPDPQKGGGFLSAGKKSFDIRQIKVSTT